MKVANAGGGLLQSQFSPLKISPKRIEDLAGLASMIIWAPKSQWVSRRTKERQKELKGRRCSRNNTTSPEQETRRRDCLGVSGDHPEQREKAFHEGHRKELLSCWPARDASVRNIRPKIKHRARERFLNQNTQRFAVDGTGIPEVTFDVGESYAGLLPITKDPDENQKLYFWFFPTDNAQGQEEITIWLNGGPGCSSLEGFLQENGPFHWQYGTFRPVRNPWSWHNLTNMIWVEQPVGTGFSEGEPTVTSEEDVAEQFLGFFRNFIDLFDLHGKKIYIAGESYAGLYVPYIADAMHAKNDTRYYNIQDILIFDPTINEHAILRQVPAVPFVEHWSHLFPLNDTTVKRIHDIADSCGYTDYMNEWLTYPPKGKMPQFPESITENKTCDVWEAIYDAVSLVNPCFNIYHATDTCPLLYDVLGFPGSFEYTPEGATIYFNRTDVQRAINAPSKPWSECSPREVFVGGQDNSQPSSFTVIPSVIEKSRNGRTIIAHGDLDYILITNGTLLSIQNMTWNGDQGFSSPPSEPLVVPYSQVGNLAAMGGAGILGKTRTERGLTYVEMHLTGHMGPQYSPAASYRVMEYLLGRIDSLSQA
ncbi:carboxypeptidase cpdS [Coccidioides immitis RMSCC 3703]|uniref:Carboxypeptidase n=1 Tax=Coccidioides immitis RMSCC 3703 TaxID=454286 RepID=A0A0J8R8P9_COCIT|nr:carboxypeptidase cpdS [Coccidioides immitis RMSCC 3703]